MECFSALKNVDAVICDKMNEILRHCAKIIQKQNEKYGMISLIHVI